MKEIKFRGKRVENGEWVFGYLYQSKEESWITDSININISTHRNFAWFRVDPDTVGRFTCIKDKDNKDIYENDIINNKFGSYGGIVTFGFYENKRFTKHDQIRKHIGWYIKGDKNESLENECWNIDGSYNLVRNNNIKVVGNIYETPHLLK